MAGFDQKDTANYSGDFLKCCFYIFVPPYNLSSGNPWFLLTFLFQRTMSLLVYALAFSPMHPRELLLPYSL